MSKSEVASGSPWKSDAEMTHKALDLWRRGIPIAGLSDGQVRILFERTVTETNTPSVVVSPSGMTTEG